MYIDGVGFVGLIEVLSMFSHSFQSSFYLFSMSVYEVFSPLYSTGYLFTFSWFGVIFRIFTFNFDIM